MTSWIHQTYHFIDWSKRAPPDFWNDSISSTSETDEFGKDDEDECRDSSARYPKQHDDIVEDDTSLLHRRRSGVLSRNQKFRFEKERNEEDIHDTRRESVPDKQGRRKFSMITKNPTSQNQVEQVLLTRKMSMNVSWSSKMKTLENIPETGQRSRARSLSSNKSSNTSTRQPMVQKNGRSLTVSLPISHP